MSEPELFKAAATDDGFVWRALGVVTAAAGAVITFLFNRIIKRHDDDIAGLHKAIAEKADKDDLKALEVRAETSRKESRESQQLLFKKVDDLRDHVDAKFDKLADLIRERRA